MKKNAKGFTLVELVAMMVVTSALFTGFLFSTTPLVNFWTYQRFYQGAGLEAKLAVMRMGRELGQIQNLTGVTTASAGTIVFRDSAGASITYALSNGALQRNNRTMAEGITGLQFLYWDENHQAIAVPTVSPSNTNIRRITVTVTAAGEGYTTTARTQVVPRNLVD